MELPPHFTLETSPPPHVFSSFLPFGYRKIDHCAKAKQLMHTAGFFLYLPKQNTGPTSSTTTS